MISLYQIKTTWLVLSSATIFAVLITGIGGRTGYTVTVGAIPADALPSGLEKLDFSVQMAIHGAMAAMSIGVKPQPVPEDEWLIQFEFEGEKYTLPMDATYAIHIGPTRWPSSTSGEVAGKFAANTLTIDSRRRSDIRRYGIKSLIFCLARVGDKSTYPGEPGVFFYCSAPDCSSLDTSVFLQMIFLYV